MAYDYSELAQHTKIWAQQLVDSHWLEPEQLADILETDTRTPQSLISPENNRPLIVAFMGGTGVGKSSLLNRLAGQEIARTGIERPTSYEVTLYHHQSVNIQSLPPKLPLEKIKISQHSEETNKNILWIDMPDFDSTELSNKELVLQWLPHIDVLIYVVSPDRYRDNKAWQLLLAEGQKHGWLFVLNQWDLAQAEQYDDFKKQLGKAGFDNPLIFRSSCVEQSDDEFIPLLNSIKSLATKSNIKQLEQHNLHARKQQLQQQLQQCLPLLGNNADFNKLNQDWQQQWTQTEALLNDAFTWSMQQHAHQYAEKDGQLLAQKIPVSLWDDWAQNRFDDLLDEMILNADQLNLPTKPLRENLQPLRESVAKSIDQQAELSCRQALANPGNLLHRAFLKLSRFCEIVLPLLAMGVVSYQLFIGFYQSAQDKQDYLGTDFAVHSVLLVLISWLFPYFIHKKMQPSIEKAAFKGLKKGLEIASLNIAADIQLSLENTQQHQQHLVEELTQYIEQCNEREKQTSLEQSTLARILPD